MDQKKVLIIDDEPACAHLLKIFLKPHNYEVLIAEDAEQAFHIAKEQMPDLIILDVMLPKIDGFMLCSLFKHDKRYANIPIILFSIRRHQEDILLGRRAGADAYITKNSDPHIIIEKINELLLSNEPQV